MCMIRQQHTTTTTTHPCEMLVSGWDPAPGAGPLLPLSGAAGLCMTCKRSGSVHFLFFPFPPHSTFTYTPGGDGASHTCAALSPEEFVELVVIHAIVVVNFASLERAGPPGPWV